MLHKTAVALAAALLAACSERAAAPAVSPAAPTAIEGSKLGPLVGSHYFGNAWPMNFIAGFRRADVPGRQDAPTTVDANDLAALHLEVTGEG